MWLTTIADIILIDKKPLFMKIKRGFLFQHRHNIIYQPYTNDGVDLVDSKTISPYYLLISHTCCRLKDYDNRSL